MFFTHVLFQNIFLGCPSPAEINNGFWIDTKVDYRTKRWRIGYELELGCDPGYVPKPKIDTTTCSGAGWSSLPNCVPGKILMLNANVLIYFLKKSELSLLAVTIKSFSNHYYL